MLGEGIRRVAVLEIGDGRRDREVGGEQHAALLLEEDDLRRRVARSRDRPPAPRPGLDHRPLLEQQVGLGPRVLAVVAGMAHGGGEQPVGDAAAPRQREPLLGRDDGIPEHLRRRGRPRRERERAAAPLHHVRGQAVVVRVRVRADEQADVPGRDAGQVEGVLERGPAGRRARAAVDEAPAVVPLEQEGVDGRRRGVGHREAEPDDPLHDGCGARLVGRSGDRAYLGRDRLGRHDRCVSPVARILRLYSQRARFPTNRLVVMLDAPSRESG